MPRPSDHPRLSALLEGPSRWHTWQHQDEVGSTNDVALAALRAGTPPGLVVTADRQRTGRGRIGRRWQDAPSGGVSLAISATVEVTGSSPLGGAVGLVPLAAGVAVADALRARGANVTLKWPNDVLVTVDEQARKCVGILVEHHHLDDRAVLVAGIGINVDWRAVPRDNEAAAWSSVAEAVGSDVDRFALLADVLGGLDARLRDDASTLRERYRRACATLGREVEATRPDGGVLRGRAVDLATDGALVVEVAGRRQSVAAGDVHHLRPAT